MSSTTPQFRTDAARARFEERLAIILEAGDVPEAAARLIAQMEACAVDVATARKAKT